MVICWRWYGLCVDNESITLEMSLMPLLIRNAWRHGHNEATSSLGMVMMTLLMNIPLNMALKSLENQVYCGVFKPLKNAWTFEMKSQWSLWYVDESLWIYHSIEFLMMVKPLVFWWGYLLSWIRRNPHLTHMRC